MIKRIFSIFVLMSMLLTACSQTAQTPAHSEQASDSGVYDLPENHEAAADSENNEQGNDPQRGDENTTIETQNNSELDGTGTQEPLTDETWSTNSGDSFETSPTESDNAQMSSVANEPTETEEQVKDVAPELLAALTLFALSMEYPDFIPIGFYAESSGKGIYASFESGGESLTAYIYPIAKERSALGTTDLYANEVGFAAFELVDSVADNCIEISDEEFVPQLSSLSSVSVFSH